MKVHTKNLSPELWRDLEALFGTRGALIAEGYPVQPRNSRMEIPPLFAFTGTVSMFEKAGFSAVETKKTGKQRVRRRLRRA